MIEDSGIQSSVRFADVTKTTSIVEYPLIILDSTGVWIGIDSIGFWEGLEVPSGPLLEQSAFSKELSLSNEREISEHQLQYRSTFRDGGEGCREPSIEGRKCPQFHIWWIYRQEDRVGGPKRPQFHTRWIWLPRGPFYGRRFGTKRKQLRIHEVSTPREMPRLAWEGSGTARIGI